MNINNTPLALAIISLFGLLGGVALTGSAQMRVNAGATWDDEPPDWGLHITTGDERYGDHEVIMNTNGQHWGVGIITAGLSTVGGLSALAMTLGGSREED
jgi:hypothetical protein